MGSNFRLLGFAGGIRAFEFSFALFTRSKQVADLVAMCGKRAAFASSVYGVGPTTASRILAKMDETEKEFLKDLFEAKLEYVTTRP